MSQPRETGEPLEALRESLDRLAAGVRAGLGEAGREAVVVVGVGHLDPGRDEEHRDQGEDRCRD